MFSYFVCRIAIILSIPTGHNSGTQFNQTSSSSDKHNAKVKLLDFISNHTTNPASTIVLETDRSGHVHTSLKHVF